MVATVAISSRYQYSAINVSVPSLNMIIFKILNMIIFKIIHVRYWNVASVLIGPLTQKEKR